MAKKEKKDAILDIIASKYQVLLFVGEQAFISKFIFSDEESYIITVGYKESIKAVQNGDITDEIAERLKNHLSAYRMKELKERYGKSATDIEIMTKLFREEIDKIFPKLKEKLISISKHLEKTRKVIKV